MAQEWITTLEGEGVTITEVDTDVIRENAAAFVDEAAVDIWGAEAYDSIQALR